VALDILNRDIRAFAASLFAPGLRGQRAEEVASLIQEADIAAGLSETLYQFARRMQREEFTPQAKPILDGLLEGIMRKLATALPPGQAPATTTKSEADGEALIGVLRARTLDLSGAVPPGERGAILAFC
jgi:phosphate:Na+ symporter